MLATIFLMCTTLCHINYIKNKEVFCGGFGSKGDEKLAKRYTQHLLANFNNDSNVYKKKVYYFLTEKYGATFYCQVMSLYFRLVAQHSRL